MDNNPWMRVNFGPSNIRVPLHPGQKNMESCYTLKFEISLTNAICSRTLIDIHNMLKDIE